MVLAMAMTAALIIAALAVPAVVRKAPRVPAPAPPVHTVSTTAATRVTIWAVCWSGKFLTSNVSVSLRVLKTAWTLAWPATVRLSLPLASW